MDPSSDLNQPRELHQLPLLTDTLGRAHRSLRLSVTDRCNLRCVYCMPETADDFQEPASYLTFEEIVRVVRLVAAEGVSKVRITGGEPTLRGHLPELVKRLRDIPGVADLAITTNGLKMVDLAESLKSAGLQRVNISLDALTEEAFMRVSRRRGVDRVLAGIDATLAAGFEEVRVNALAIRNLNEEQILPLARWARDRGVTLRFIEYMPLGGDRSWQEGQVISGTELRSILEDEFGPLSIRTDTDTSQPSRDFQYADCGGTVGFINSVSEPFCGTCDRLRLTAEGNLRNCLFSDEEWPLREALRSGVEDLEILEIVRSAVQAKKPGHLISQPKFRQPDRPMYRIGG